MEYKGGFVYKYYFKLRITQGEATKNFTRELRKSAYMHPDYPNEVVIIYNGDVSAVNPDYINGNAKSEQKLSQTFFLTVPSILIEAKERKDEPPAKVHLDIIKNAPQEMIKQASEASRNIQQIHNAQKAARRAEMISQDAQYNVYEVGTDIDFLDGYQLRPHVAFVGVQKGIKTSIRLVLHSE